MKRAIARDQQYGVWLTLQPLQISLFELPPIGLLSRRMRDTVCASKYDVSHTVSEVTLYNLFVFLTATPRASCSSPASA